MLPELIGAAAKRIKCLQRIYGISSPNKRCLDEHLRLLEEAQSAITANLGRNSIFFHSHSEGAGFLSGMETAWCSIMQ